MRLAIFNKRLGKIKCHLQGYFSVQTTNFWRSLLATGYKNHVQPIGAWKIQGDFTTFSLKSCDNPQLSYSLLLMITQ